MSLNDAFFRKLKALSVTFDDIDFKNYEVTLASGYSEVMPSDVSTKTKFSRNVPLQVPLVGSAMEFMEHKLAIALAMEGGIGIIHRNLSPEMQAKEVAKTKLHLHGALITSPIAVSPDQTMEEVLAMREQKGYEFHSFPVVKEGKLVGVITKNNVKFCPDYRVRVGEVMTTDMLLGKKGMASDEAFMLMQKHEKGVLPVVDNEKHLLGLYVYSDLKRSRSGSSLHNVDGRGQLRVGAAIGVGARELDRTEKLVGKNVDVLVVDTAHADSKAVYEMMRMVKDSFPQVDLVVGNVSSEKSARRLLERGLIDGIKIGQGPGSICTTRVIAGIGCPQITAIYRSAKIAKHYGVPVCADGGIRFSGDITKAIAAGAQSVMIGGLFAGTRQAASKMVRLKGRVWKANRGMGSEGAMRESSGSRERYRQSEAETNGFIPEGIEGLVPFAGDLHEVAFQLVGGLKSGMAYQGAATIKELQKKAEFELVSPMGQKESHPHDVVITKEAPNYSQED